MKPVVAIVGRPNVGKSSLFNRMLGRRKALVEDRPGVTRDRNYALAEHNGRAFILVDTGGFDDSNSRDLAKEVREQALLAMEEADVIVLLMDARAGITSLDSELATRLRKVKQPVIYAANKVDHPSVLNEIYEFMRLGVDEVIPVSAAHGYGVDDLMDAVLEHLPEEGGQSSAPAPWEGEGVKRRPSRKEARARAMAERAADQKAWEDMDGITEEEAEGGVIRIVDAQEREALAMAEVEEEALLDALERAGEAPLPEDFQNDADEGDVTSVGEVEESPDFAVRIAVLGRPNVGKSTLVNRLLGFTRTIISEMPGTTRDSVDTHFTHDGAPYILIDTAGIRRKARISDRVERYSVARALRSLEACHIALLLIDATEGLTEQEARLAALADDRGRALILVINKWDAITDGADARKALEAQMDRRLPHVRYARVLTLSALTGKGLGKLWEAITSANAAHRQRIPTARLNQWLTAAALAQPPALWRRYPVKFYFATQIGTRPPVVMIQSNRPEGLNENYRRYLMNRFRDEFSLQGTPIKLLFRKRE